MVEGRAARVLFLGVAAMVVTSSPTRQAEASLPPGWTSTKPELIEAAATRGIFIPTSAPADLRASCIMSPWTDIAGKIYYGTRLRTIGRVRAEIIEKHYRHVPKAADECFVITRAEAENEGVVFSPRHGHEEFLYINKAQARVVEEN